MLWVDFASNKFHGTFVLENSVPEVCECKSCETLVRWQLCPALTFSSPPSPSSPPPHWLIFPGTRWPPACSTSDGTLEKAPVGLLCLRALSGLERLRLGAAAACRALRSDPTTPPPPPPPAADTQPHKVEPGITWLLLT